MLSLIKGISSHHPDLIQASSTRHRRKRLKHFSNLNDHLESHVGEHFRNALSYRHSVRHRREPVPVRKMTHALSSSFHPGVPHFWLCDGRLLVLEDPTNKDNIGLFRVRPRFRLNIEIRSASFFLEIIECCIARFKSYETFEAGLLLHKGLPSC